MSTNERDTHFADFAQALARELTEAHIFYDVTGRGQLILVRRAYDLVQHTILNIGPADLDMLTTEECVQRVPDLTVLPEVEE